MPDMPDHKFCRDCQAFRPVSEFTRNKRNKDGLSFYCGPCSRRRVIESRRRRLGPPKSRCGQGPKDVPVGFKWCPDCGAIKALDEFPLNRSAPSGRGAYCKPCFNEIVKANRDKNHGSTRNYHLRRRYGISVDDFDRMSAAQNGVCAICREAPAEHVDHDHATGRVRGLLCFNCNGALGQFRDRTDLMLLAVAYLRRDAVPDGAEIGLHYVLGDFADPRPPEEPRAA